MIAVSEMPADFVATAYGCQVCALEAVQAMIRHRDRENRHRRRVGRSDMLPPIDQQVGLPLDPCPGCGHDGHHLAGCALDPGEPAPGPLPKVREWVDRG